MLADFRAGAIHCVCPPRIGGVEAAVPTKFTAQGLVALQTVSAEIAQARVHRSAEPTGAAQAPARSALAGLGCLFEHEHPLPASGKFIGDRRADYTGADDHDVWSVEPGLHRRFPRFTECSLTVPAGPVRRSPPRTRPSGRCGAGIGNT